MSYTPQNRPPRTQGQPTVIVKLREQREQLIAAVVQSGGGGGRRDAEPLWQRVRQKYPGATVERAMPGINPELIARAQSEAGSPRAVPDLNTFYRIRLPANARGVDVADFVQTGENRTLVETAYVDAGAIPAAINPIDDPKFWNQPYLRGRQKNKRGIYANFAWAKPGGDGTGVGVVFVEFGWQLNHEDLADAKIALISGVNGTDPDGREHGTNCVGEVMGQDNGKGIVGIAPNARCRVVSLERAAGNFNLPEAIMSGILAMSRGDVMSISLQTAEDKANPYPATGFRPIEIADLEFAVIKLGTLLGRVICTAAGNGQLDLDKVTNAAGKLVLKRGHADFKESGAIMVGAATETRPHQRVSASNFGSRVDSFAQGQNITTTSTTGAKYVDNFRNTSGATPIIAGAAVQLQGMVKDRIKSVLSVAQVRSVLAGAKTSIRSNNPASDKIGRMPNMQLICQHFVETLKKPMARSKAADEAEPVLYLDPGHGGEAAAGQSSAYGGSGSLGVYEKDIALNVAQRVQAHYGGPCQLSRDGDYNLSLQQRINAARRSNAGAFVSLHAHSGAVRHAGPEVWVYGNGDAAPDPHSTMLAEQISEQIGEAYGGPVPVRAGRLSVLDPRMHRSNIAACLVEAGSLSDPIDERRVVDAETAEVIGAAVARGVQRYMGTVAFEAEDADPEDTQYEKPRGQAFADDENGESSEDGIQQIAHAYEDSTDAAAGIVDYDAY